jgi:hypothetical protein
MTRQQVLEEIGKALAVLTHQVEQENLSGMFSKNRIIEDILLPVFAILFSAPGLHNLNSVGSNNAHLDLGDDTTHLGIQVTAENSAEKITKTLTGVVRDGAYTTITIALSYSSLRRGASGIRKRPSRHGRVFAGESSCSIPKGILSSFLHCSPKSQVSVSTIF